MEPITFDEARALAADAHGDQEDKLGVGYMEHVDAVADGLADYDLDLQVAAVLHDVVEDTPVTLDDLRARGVSERSLAAIALVSKNLHTGSDYAESIGAITASRDATLVKIADNAHNSRPDRVRALRALPDHTATSKYDDARRVLWAAVPQEDVERIVGRVAPELLG